uniref:NADH dehydrogenase subunit 6 n=1 Tax=Chlorophila portschinski TaxID=2969964 RepID=UPI002176C094|nr:NADH dehydrogenase subunit 6 [Chlorophila portschinski]UUL71662.1 NADH dehydrogenase subunit 6 [Chlorophila portschinski]
MSIILSINIMLSTLFILMNHPLSMGVVLLLQTVSISMITGNLMLNFWYSYVLFLIMIGGMLILFMYMTSIASNEKFKTSMSILLSIAVIPATLIYQNWYTMLSHKTTDTEMLPTMPLPHLSLTKFIQPNTSVILVFLMAYLFLALIATVKIASNKSGPLRQMN